MRLGVLDLLKTDADGRESLASYILHHLALYQPDVLGRWPSAYRIALRAAKGTLRLHGELYDLDAIVGTRLLGEAADERERTLKYAEMLGSWLLEAVAQDTKQFYGGYGARCSAGEKRLNLHSTSLMVLRLVREGGLGPLCLDAHPFVVPPRSSEEILAQKRAKRAERRRRLGKKVERELI